MGNCAPDPHLLLSVINQNHPWWKVLAEWVDNSFDAGATQVAIECENRVLSVFDDGHGVADISALLTLGKHVKGRQSSLGVYGIGAKDAWLSCANVMEVTTVHQGMKYSGRFDYKQIANHNWDYQDPQVSPTAERPYTRLRFPLRMDKSVPPATAWEELAWRFTPAIRSGRSIVLQTRGRRRVLPPVDEPPVTEVIQSDFDVDGRKVTIKIGLMPRGQKVKKGPFWLIFGHRIIMHTSLGCGGYGTAGLFGTITLHEGWRTVLTKNKDSLANHQQLLEESILNRIEPLLRKAQDRSESIESSLLRRELEEILNSSDELSINGDEGKKRRKAKRNPRHSKTGTVQSAGTGTPHSTARRISPDKPGGCTTPRGGSEKRRGFSLEFTELDIDAIGDFDAMSGKVRLNLSHEFIAFSKASGNRPALFAAAIALIADHGIREPNGVKILKCCYDSFADAFGNLIRSVSQEVTSHAG